MSEEEKTTVPEEKVEEPTTETPQPPKPNIESASDAECATAARQLQKFIEQKPFEGGGDFFMEGLVLHGELEVPKDMSTSIRVFRAAKRLSMSGENLAKQGFSTPPEGYKRIYQLEVTLVVDTVKDAVMEVNEGHAGNTMKPGEVPTMDPAHGDPEIDTTKVPDGPNLKIHKDEPEAEKAE